MPHLVLEISSNIVEKSDISDFFLTCHQFLAESLPTQLSSCKSRLIEHHDYCLGDGAEENAFIHLTLKIMPGRSAETLNKVGESILSALKKWFADSLVALNCQISLEIIEIEKTYFKFDGAV